MNAHFKMTMTHKKIKWLYFSAILLLLLLSLFSLKVGAMSTSWYELYHYIFQPENNQTLTQLIITTDRLPRTLAAILIGMALAVSGVILQAISQNPIACPSLLGVNQGAAFAMVITLLIWPAISSFAYIPITFIGGLLAYALVYIICLSVGLSPVRFTLAGVAINAALYSMIQALLIAFPYQAQEVVFHLNGSLSGINMEQVMTVVLPITIAVLVVICCSAQLQLLTLGIDTALSVGLSAKFAIAGFLLISVLLAACAVSIAGPLFFFGLIVPQILKSLVILPMRQLVILSSLYGAVFLLLADVALRLVAPQQELPVGALIALIGAPVLAMLLKYRLPAYAD